MEEAWTEEWIRSQGDLLRRVSFALLRREDLADDAAQEAFLSGLQQERRRVRTWPAWLIRVTRHAALRLQRERDRRRDFERLYARNETLPLETVDRDESLRLVAAAVTNLNPPVKEVVLLRFYDGLPPRRIAHALRIPVATVRSRLQRGLAAVRQELERRMVEQDWQAALLPVIGPQRQRRTWWIPWTIGAALLFGLLLFFKKTGLIAWIQQLLVTA